MKSIARSFLRWVLPKTVRNKLVDVSLSFQRDKEKIFTRYYVNNTWQSNESRSGIGSTLEHTERLRSQLPIFFEKFNVCTFLDAPCGDFNWFRHVQRGKINYVGGDIVRSMIEKNNQLYADSKTRFTHLDITRDPLPSADVWMCRDVLFHLSDRDIFHALSNFVRSDIPYILTTTFPDCTENRDVPTGSFRLINLELRPFNFGSPEYVLLDSVETWQKRHLGLWSREKITEVLQKKGVDRDRQYFMPPDNHHAPGKNAPEET